MVSIQGVGEQGFYILRYFAGMSRDCILQINYNKCKVNQEGEP